MVSHLHELVIEVFTKDPRLVEVLVGDAVPEGLPAGPVLPESGEFSEYAAIQWRADQVFRFGVAPHQTAVVLEVQLSRDDEKEWAWPVYVANLRARSHCPVVLVVICVTRALARRYDRPIELGPGSVVGPVVIGPDQIPVVADVAAALESPELAALSAAAHPDRKDVLGAAAEAFARIEPERGAKYYQVLADELPDLASAYLKEVMMSFTETWRPRTGPGKVLFEEGEAKGLAKGLAEGEAKGEAKGEVRAILRLLDVRGVRITAAARERITACTDLDQLDIWLARAATARKIDELFD
jgi:hypothetical protein